MTKPMTKSMTKPLHQTAPFRRTPCEVMQLARMGSAHPTRISFLRSMLRMVQTQNWKFSRPIWQLDKKGVGHAVYCAKSPTRTYSLVVFSHDLPASQRTDRVIATAWDATFTLFDGTPNAHDLARLAKNVPLQEAGRVSNKELSLSRANRSVRLFDYVVDCLAHGQQPCTSRLCTTGYLMRTTAVYGTGKFGTADRSHIATRKELRPPFRAEMLSVWLTRSFTIDLVEHLAHAKGGNAATTLNNECKKLLGVGNSTGLGMAPFLINHPILLNNWILAREESLAQVRAQDFVLPNAKKDFQIALNLAIENANTWQSEHELQQKKLKQLRTDLLKIDSYVKKIWDSKAHQAWNVLWQWGANPTKKLAGQTLTLEGQEALLALMLEPHGRLVDGFCECMDANEEQFFTIDGTMELKTLQALIKKNYAWALKINFNEKKSRAKFWYVSQEKLEPRLGLREIDEGATRELPLCIAFNINKLCAALAKWRGDSLAEFLLAHPEHRATVRRVQFSRSHPYGEVQENLTDAAMLPIDLLRCKLAFFGATKFDPRSDLWVRISLFQGLPYPQIEN